MPQAKQGLKIDIQKNVFQTHLLTIFKVLCEKHLNRKGRFRCSAFLTWSFFLYPITPRQNGDNVHKQESNKHFEYNTRAYNNSYFFNFKFFALLYRTRAIISRAY